MFQSHKLTKELIFDGKKLAQQAKVFYETKGKDIGKLEYIKGNEWIAGNISYHLPERPKWIYSDLVLFPIISVIKSYITNKFI